MKPQATSEGSVGGDEEYELQPLEPSSAGDNNVLLISEPAVGGQPDSGWPWFYHQRSEDLFLAESVACICPAISCASLQMIVFIALLAAWFHDGPRAIYSGICLASSTIGVVALSVAHVRHARLTPPPKNPRESNANPFSPVIVGGDATKTDSMDSVSAFTREADANFARTLEKIALMILLVPVMAKLVFVTQRDEFALLAADPANNGPHAKQDPMSSVALPVDLFVLLTAPMMLSARWAAIAIFLIAGFLIVIVTVFLSRPDSGDNIPYTVSYACLEITAILLGVLSVLRNDKEHRQRFIARRNLDLKTAAYITKRNELDALVLAALPSTDSLHLLEAQHLECATRYMRLLHLGAVAYWDGPPPDLADQLLAPAIGSQSCTIAVIDATPQLGPNVNEWAIRFGILTQFFDALCQEHRLHRLSSWHGTLMASSGFSDRTDAATALKFMLDLRRRLIPELPVDALRGALVTGVCARGFSVTPNLLRWNAVGPAIKDTLSLLRNVRCVGGHCWIDATSARNLGRDLANMEGVQPDPQWEGFQRFPLRILQSPAAPTEHHLTTGTPTPGRSPAALPKPAVSNLSTIGRGTSDDEDEQTAEFRRESSSLNASLRPAAYGSRRADHIFLEAPSHIDTNLYTDLFARTPAPVPEPIPRNPLLDPFFPKFEIGPNMYYRGILADLSVRFIQLYATVPLIPIIGLFLVLNSSTAWGSVVLLAIATVCLLVVAAMAVFKKLMVGRSGPSILRFTVAVLATVFTALSAFPVSIASRRLEVNLISYVAVVLHMWTMSYVIDPLRFAIHAGVNIAICIMFIAGANQPAAIAVPTWSIVLMGSLCIWRKQSKEAIRATQLMAQCQDKASAAMHRNRDARMMLRALVCPDLTTKINIDLIQKHLQMCVGAQVPRTIPIYRFIRNTVVLRIDLAPARAGQVMMHDAVMNPGQDRAPSSGSRPGRDSSYATAQPQIRWMDGVGHFEESTATAIVVNSWRNHTELGLGIAEAQAHSVARASFRRTADGAIGPATHFKPIIDLVGFCGDSATITGQLPWCVAPSPEGIYPAVVAGTAFRWCKSQIDMALYHSTVVVELVATATIVTKRINRMLPFTSVQCAIDVGDVVQLVTGRSMLQATAFGSGITRADSLVRHVPPGRLVIGNAANCEESRLSEAVRNALERPCNDGEQSPITTSSYRTIPWESFPVPGDHPGRILALSDLVMNKPSKAAPLTSTARGHME